ncbi:MAG: hypothetical protein R2941_06915 [Desulfobacterales bacterium]
MRQQLLSKCAIRNMPYTILLKTVGYTDELPIIARISGRTVGQIFRTETPTGEGAGAFVCCPLVLPLSAGI